MAVRAVPDESQYWVDAAPFRAQLRHLMASSSLSAEEVAAAAGISAGWPSTCCTGGTGGRCAGSARTPPAGCSGCRSSQLRPRRPDTEAAA